jgi:hypothetical protein
MLRQMRQPYRAARVARLYVYARARTIPRAPGKRTSGRLWQAKPKIARTKYPQKGAVPRIRPRLPGPKYL